MTRQTTVLLALSVVAVLLLAPAFMGVLSNAGIDIVQIIGGLSVLAFCRPISEWVTNILQRWPVSLTAMGRSIGPIVIALAGAVLALCGLQDLIVR